MKRGRTLPLTGAQLVALVALFRGRPASTNVIRPLVRLGLAEWYDPPLELRDGKPPLKAGLTPNARLLVRDRVYLAPMPDPTEVNGYDASFEVVADADVIGYVYHYPKGRRVLADLESLGPLSSFSALGHPPPSWMIIAIEQAATRVVAERRKARKAIDITEDVDAARPSDTVKPSTR